MRTLLVNLITALALLGITSSALAMCKSGVREIDFSDRPETIYVGDIWTEVIFPEPIIGRLKQKPEGLQDNKTTPFSDRLYFKTSENTYTGMVFVHGKSGQTYTLRLLARANCPDTIVRGYGDASISSEPPTVNARGRSTSRRKLMEFMLLGYNKHNKPKGVRIERPEGSKAKRLVFKQGPVHFYVEEIWKGQRAVGTVLLAENMGRTPYRVAIEAINFSSPQLTKLFGRISEVTMQPYDFRLAPAPEYAIDHRSTKHRGLVYIVSQRPRRARR